MDGGNRKTLISGLVAPFGITIDFPSQHLYWADEDEDKIYSSNLDGRNVQAALPLPKGTEALGIATLGERIFWGTSGTVLLCSSTKNGSDARIEFSGIHGIAHIAAVAPLKLPSGRMNHCKGRNCSKVCVLTANSARCLE